MNTQQDMLQTVPFYGDNVYLVNHRGKPYIPAKPIIDNFGIDWKAQHRKLVNNSKRWGTMGIVTIVAADGKRREMVCLPLRKLPAFLFSIDSRRVKPEARGKIELYQEECDEALWNYWDKGVAVSPSVSMDSLEQVFEGLGFTFTAKKEPITPLPPPEPETITLSMAKYAELLECKVKMLESTTQPRRRNLTDREKSRILALSAQGLGPAAIGKAVGRSKASVSTFLRLHRKKQH